MIARNKPRVCIGPGLNIRDHGQNRRNAVRVHVSYRAFLRARAFRPNEAEVDWPNIAEEIESVGRSQLSAVQSLLRQVPIHMLKAEAWPLSREVPHWRAETRRFRDDAAEAFTPSMRQQRINLARLYVQALRATPETIDGQAPLPMPESCLVTLDDLLSDDPWP